jgi:hypothetical protein
MYDPTVLDHSLLKFEKTEVIIIISILQMVMKRAGYLTSLKYSLRNIDCKEEPKPKFCRISTKRLKKFTTP